LYNCLGESNDNEENFRAILKYKDKDIDYMKSYLETESKNKYISDRTQNEKHVEILFLKKLLKLLMNQVSFLY